MSFIFSHLEKDRQRRKAWRCREKSKEDVDKERAKSRIRSQRYRDKLKGATGKTCVSSPKKARTRAEIDKQREYWTKMKKESRLRQSSQKKRRVKEYDRNRKNIDDSDNMDKEITVSDVWLPTEDEVLSPDAVRKAASRATKSLPKNPQKFACVLERVLHKASPRKRQAFEQLTKGDSSDPVVEEIKRLKTQKDRKSIIKRRCFIKTLMKKYKNCYAMSRATNIKYDYLRKCRKF